MRISMELRGGMRVSGEWVGPGWYGVRYGRDGVLVFLGVEGDEREAWKVAREGCCLSLVGCFHEVEQLIKEIEAHAV